LTGSPRAPLLLFLHGFLGSARDWSPVTAALSSRFRCCAVDLPGHGETGGRVGDDLWGMEGCADALGRLIGELSADRAGVIGYSLGGRLALHLAARHPARVRGAVVVSASPGLADAEARASRRRDDELLAQRLEEEGLERFLDAWYRLPLFATLRSHPCFDDVRERRGRNDPRLLARSLRSMGLGSQAPLWQALPGLPVPLLLLVGAGDPKFTAIGRQVAEIAPGATLRIQPGRGHALVEEDPGAVAAEIAAFFDGAGAARPLTAGTDDRP
jgi:2-succinyl-6-hydroxy-2,4-cyclohexadiene-1-carboxylate synthase